MTVTVFTKPHCPQCDATKRQLTKLGVPFETVDLTQNPSTLEQLQAAGFQQAPVVITPDNSWTGYRPDLIREVAQQVAADNRAAATVSGESEPARIRGRRQDDRRIGLLLVGLRKHRTVRGRMPFAGRRHQRLPHPVAGRRPALNVREPYVIMVPTYGGGVVKKAVPIQVKRFLNDPANREWIRGVIASGNTNFGEAYCAAGDIIAAKCKVPYLYRYELMGTPEDTAAVRNGLVRFFTEQ